MTDMFLREDGGDALEHQTLASALMCVWRVCVSTPTRNAAMSGKALLSLWQPAPASAASVPPRHDILHWHWVHYEFTIAARQHSRFLNEIPGMFMGR